MDQKVQSKIQRIRKSLSRLSLRESFRKKIRKMPTIQRPRPERPKPIVILDSESNSSESSVRDSDNNSDELEEPPIPVSKFEEHVIANHADSDGGFATEYEDIQTVGNNFPSLAGSEEGNKLKNRYTNIVAYDHTRVCLQTLPGHPDSHYINANYIDSYIQQCAYIATQGPLKNTIEDFGEWCGNKTVM